MAEDEATLPEDENEATEQEVDSSALEAAVDQAVEADGGGVGSSEGGGESCPECKKGSPPWMATFADMATLLMAFFVLILSFSDTEVPRFEYINGSIQFAFGVKKLIPKIEIPKARSVIVETFTPNEAAPTVLDDPRQRELDRDAENLVRRTKTEPERFIEDLEKTKIALSDQISSGLVTVSTDGSQIVVKVNNADAAGADFGSGESSEGTASQVLVETAAIVAEVQSTTTREIGIYLSDVDGPEEVESSEELIFASQFNEERLNNRFENIKADLNSEINNGLLEVEREGDEVVIRIASQGSFNSGSAVVAQSFTTTLDRVGDTISQESGDVRIEGHTDNIPVAFSDTFNSNWDLSAARAASVAAYLTSSSELLEERIEVLGFADTLPLASNDSADGRSRNRRIEIRIAN
ncbi:MAG: OmpA family protein [Pseudohongiellaceae bacterium]